MKKILFFAMGVAIAMTSCESGITEEVDTSGESAKVHVNLSGFEIETTTRATTTADKVGVTGIVFAVVNSKGEIVYSAQQSSGSEGFGAVSFELTEGVYTFVAEAHIFSGLASISVSNGKAIATVGGSEVYETFAASEQVEIKAGNEINLQMTLSRITAQLSLVTKDNQPSGVAKVQIFIGDTSKPAYTDFSIDLTSGTMAGFGEEGHLAREWSRTATHAGKPTTQDCALLLAAEEQTLPVKIVALNASGETIRSHTISEVPFKQNCTTTITGEFYNTSAAGSFQFDTEWGENIEGGW